MSKQLTVGLALVAGAFGGALSGAIGSARADDDVPRSAYFCFEASNVSDLTTKANAAAQRGWRMVEGVGHPGASIWCFTQRR